MSTPKIRPYLVPVSPPKLTDVEHKVLKLLADGVSRKQAGRDLGLTIDQVRYALERATKKFGVDNRIRLIVAAVKAGLL